MTTPVDDDDQADDAAPYGVNPKTGRPYRVSPERRAAMGAQLTAGRQKKARTTTGRASGGGRASVKGNSALATYTRTVAGALQIPAMGLAAAARMTHNPLFMLDSLAVTRHTPELAEAIAALALEDAAFAAVLDRVGQVGPYGALFAAVTPLLVQLGANHGLVGPMPEMGILSPTELMRDAGMEVPDEEAFLAPATGPSDVPA